MRVAQLAKPIFPEALKAYIYIYISINNLANIQMQTTDDI